MFLAKTIYIMKRRKYYISLQKGEVMTYDNMRRKYNISVEILLDSSKLLGACCLKVKVTRELRFLLVVVTKKNILICQYKMLT